MRREDFTVGTRVEVATPIEIYPIATFPVGLRGVVIEAFPEAGLDDIVALVRLDRHYDGLNEWSNALQVWGGEINNGGSDCTVDCFDRDLLPLQFPEFPLDGVPDLPEGWLGNHYCHNACPSWFKNNLVLWVEHPDPALRDTPETKRYVLQWCPEPGLGTDEDLTLCTSNDWDEVRAAMEQADGSFEDMARVFLGKGKA